MLIMLISMYVDYSHVIILVLQYGRLPETIKEQQQTELEPLAPWQVSGLHRSV